MVERLTLNQEVDGSTPSLFATFNDFWLAYPKRLGANPKAPAQKKFLAAVKAGVLPERIVSAAKAYADELRARQKIGTEFVCQAQTWLNQRRWDDYAGPMEAKDRQRQEEYMASQGFRWNGEKWEKF